MKKILALSVILLLVCQSCLYFDIEPSIKQKFSNEDLAVVPYHKGQQFNMIDQNNDTLLWIINEDTIFNNGYSYNRHININSPDSNKKIISLDLWTNKQLDIYYYNANNQTTCSQRFNLNDCSPRTLVIDNNTFYNVYVSSSDDPSNQIIYSISQGIIRIQKDSNYLQLIP